MTESEFLRLVDSTLSTIADAFEDAGQHSDVDVDCSRSGSLLEVEFLHTDSKIIINSQAAINELWVAAKSGAYHFKYDGKRWMSTRDASELMTLLKQIAFEQAGLNVDL